jgi:hypothetical protein
VLLPPDTGYTADEFRQMPDVEYFHPDYLEYMQGNQKTLSNPDIPNPVLFKIKHKDGHIYGSKGC